MNMQIKINPEIQELLRCPVCKEKIKIDKEYIKCMNCQSIFPIIKNIPVLINEKQSIFSISYFRNNRDTFFKISRENEFKAIFNKLIPTISKNIKAEKNYRKFADLLFNRISRPKVLIIGGSILGEGIKSIFEHSSIELIESDVSFGPRTSLICDVHDIPFEDASFDAVIVQAVLEHVVDPYRAVDEIHRVLKEDGLVYAETPFMQQVHGGRYDFTRFTYLGHRRLFRKFTELESGACLGPGSALAWSYQYFFLSFTKNLYLRKFIYIFAAITSFYLKYFDYLLIDKDAALDAASGYYFMGQKSLNVLSDRELIMLYKGTL